MKQNRKIFGTKIQINKLVRNTIFLSSITSPRLLYNKPPFLPLIDISDRLTNLIEMTESSHLNTGI